MDRAYLADLAEIWPAHWARPDLVGLQARVLPGSTCSRSGPPFSGLKPLLAQCPPPPPAVQERGAGAGRRPHGAGGSSGHGVQCLQAQGGACSFARPWFRPRSLEAGWFAMRAKRKSRAPIVLPPLGRGVSSWGLVPVTCKGAGPRSAWDCRTSHRLRGWSALTKQPVCKGSLA